MTYLVLARKWRPRSFDTLIGQDHVVRALTHALSTQRLHHAWLFTGTRGVGKTTLSRILAKSLNCEIGITATPCGVCRACTEIDSGRFVDYIELDAASNRGVDDMTQLLEQAVYAPSSGRFKVYMIDEVHMLTGHAFNAMLKTLEEPPPHVKFILATTDPQKIPVTVLSRCLQFNLKQMTAESMVGHLQEVLGQESIQFETPALRLIAQAASGSMRDALSLTDQAIAYSAGHLTTDSIQGMLGTLDQRYLVRLLQALAAGSGAEVLSVADELASRGLSYAGALADLAVLLSRVAIEQRVSGTLPADDPLAADIVALGQAIHPDLVQLFYSVAVHSRHELSLAPDEYAGFVMACLRMLALAPEEQKQGPGPGPEQVSGSGDDAVVEPAVAASTSLSTAAAAAAPPIPAVQPSAPAAPAVTVAQSPASAAAAATRLVAPAPVPAAPVMPASTAQAQVSPDTASASAGREIPAWEDMPASSPSHPAPSFSQPEPLPAEPESLPGGEPLSSPEPSSVPEVSFASEPLSTSEPAPIHDRAVPEEPLHIQDALASSSDPALSQDAAPGEAPDFAGPDDFQGFDSYSDAEQFDDSVELQGFVPVDADDETFESAAQVVDDAAVPVFAASRKKSKSLKLRDMTAQAWPALAAQLPLTGLAAELARQSEWLGAQADQVNLRVAVRTLAESPGKSRLCTLLSEYFGAVVRLNVEYGATGDATAHAVEQAQRALRQKEAEQAAQADPFVQALISDFGARIVPDSIRPGQGSRAT